MDFYKKIIWNIYFFKFHLNCRVASGSRTAHDPAGWGHHHKDRRWLEETEHAVPLSGTLLAVYRKMQLDPVFNSLCSTDLIVTNVSFVFVEGVERPCTCENQSFTPHCTENGVSWNFEPYNFRLAVNTVQKFTLQGVIKVPRLHPLKKEMLSLNKKRQIFVYR